MNGLDGKSINLPAARRMVACMGRWVWVCMLLVGMPMHAMAQSGPWQVVQAMPRMHDVDVVVQHFVRWLPEYMSEPAVLHEASRGQDIGAVQWAAMEAPKQRTVVLVSALLLGKMDQQGVGDMDRRVLVPLQMVLEGAWCLRAAASHVLTDYRGLQAWLQSLQRPVKIAMPSDYGMLRLWVKAMERKTGVPWEVQAAAPSSAQLEALAQGQVDLLMDRCYDIDAVIAASDKGGAKAAMRGLTKVLARSGTNGAAPAVHSFADWQFPPLAPGWLAWFAPVGMSAARQQQVATALHKVLMREDTQRLIAGMGYTPANRTPQESMERVRQQQREWRQLQQWLDSQSESEPHAPLRLAQPL